ncbi:Transcriptional regulator [Pseudomonas cichorii]|uniref:Transcriptional regulator n=1 Tax=Pseudomonas cichorii TaxID=36746 RepID=A0A3M4LPE0_PSECI|nr:LysR family transcriptional regulator [Pseudomonas cichorii]RMQ43316.1 Transcriptional regulator [Pseudomonas cichorii]
MNKMNISTLDLNLLKVFEALHDESSASRAALRLGVTQSAISAALKRLREVYGDQLFVRTGRGLAPTLRADQLKPVVTDALNKCRQSLAMIAPAPGHYEGRSVVIGLSDDFEMALARRLMAVVREQAPGLRLIFRQTHSQIVATALLERTLDLAIASGGFANRLLTRRVLGEGDYSCLVDPASLKPGQTTLSIEEFIQREHILISSGGLIGMVDEGLASLGLSRQVCASTTHFAALPYLLSGTQALSTIPTHAAQAIARLTRLALLPCPLGMPRYPIELGWRTGALPDPAVESVREAIIGLF